MTTKQRVPVPRATFNQLLKLATWAHNTPLFFEWTDTQADRMQEAFSNILAAHLDDDIEVFDVEPGPRGTLWAILDVPDGGKDEFIEKRVPIVARGRAKR